MRVLEIIGLFLCSLQEDSQTSFIFYDNLCMTPLNLVVSLKFFFSQLLYWNSFTSSNNIIINGRNSTVIICSVYGGLQDHNLQIDLRNVDIYTIPRSCYNQSAAGICEVLFYVLVKISVTKMKPKKFNALCACWEMIITPVSLTSLVFQNLVVG